MAKIYIYYKTERYSYHFFTGEAIWDTEYLSLWVENGNFAAVFSGKTIKLVV